MPTDTREEILALLAAAKTATLATLLPGGAPYASLVSLTTAGNGLPLFLFSRLARHTRNLLHDRRASLLLQSRATSAADPLAETRASLIGTVSAHRDESFRACFLKAHPEAAAYIDFTDFSFFAMSVERAHLIAGFGRIVDIPGTELFPL